MARWIDWLALLMLSSPPLIFTLPAAAPPPAASVSTQLPFQGSAPLLALLYEAAEHVSSAYGRASAGLRSSRSAAGGASNETSCSPIVCAKARFTFWYLIPTCVIPA